MYRAGFEPARFLRARFTVWRFQPLTHRYLLKLAGAVGIEPTSVCFGGRLAAEDMDPYLEKMTWTGLEPANPGVKGRCVLQFHHHAMKTV